MCKFNEDLFVKYLFLVVIWVMICLKWYEWWIGVFLLWCFLIVIMLGGVEIIRENGGVLLGLFGFMIEFCVV